MAASIIPLASCGVDGCTTFRPGMCASQASRLWLCWAAAPVPEGYYTEPLNEARVRRTGEHVTIVGNAIMVHKALEAAEILAAEGISAEVIDLRSLRPMDYRTVINSVSKTTRLICVYEGTKELGIGAEVSAAIAESEAFDRLDAPILRLGGADCPLPYNPDLERAAVPQVPDIVAAARRTVRRGV